MRRPGTTRGIVIAVATSLLLPLTGCAAANREEDYLRALDQSAPALFATHSTRDLLARGAEACDSLATNTLATLFDGEVVEGSDGVTVWARIVDAAVVTLCPEHRVQLDEWMEEHK